MHFYFLYLFMLKAYKYRLNPNKSQKKFFDQSFGCCRFIYNWALDKKISAYQQDKTRLTAIDLCKELTNLKKQSELEWLNNPTNECLQQSIRNMESAFTRFFREKKGFPKFKTKHKSKLSAKYVNGVQIDFDTKRIKIPKAKWVKLFLDRTFHGKIGTVTISKDPTGKYWVSVLVDNQKELPKKAKVKYDTAVGVDVGIKDFAILSNGEKISNPKFLESEQKRLAILQRRLARKQKGSNRRNGAKLLVAKCHERIRNKRNNFLHHITSKIVAENQSIIIEDLNVDGMLKNHCLAKSISSVAWSEFFRQLEYKCEWNGKNLIRIGRFEPSSKMCSGCGFINKEIKLSDREWVCIECGSVHDRDLNAAINIKKFGLEKQNLIGYSPAVSGVEDVESLAMAGAKKRQYIESVK